MENCPVHGINTYYCKNYLLKDEDGMCLFDTEDDYSYNATTTMLSDYN